MEILIEMSGLDQEDSFKTILDDNIKLINIGEMIKEAGYYQAFNLSEQFCLQIKDTDKFIGVRSTIIKKCLNEKQINAQTLIFHKGLDGQILMNKGETIDNQPVIINQNIHNQPKSQMFDQDITKKQNNDQQQKGVQIGGEITESQNLRNVEQRINQGYDVQQGTSNNHSNTGQTSQIINQQQSQILIQQSQQGQQFSLQNQSLLETRILNNKNEYKLKILTDPQQFQKYIELFKKDNIEYEII